jgi:hypothetical protein
MNRRPIMKVYTQCGIESYYHEPGVGRVDEKPGPYDIVVDVWRNVISQVQFVDGRYILVDVRRIPPGMECTGPFPSQMKYTTVG